MQPPARSGLTAAQVTALIRDARAVEMVAGLELLDMNLNVLEDITDDLAGGSVSRAGYNTLHGTAELAISRELDWGTAVVRPYLTMTDGTVSARFNLGAYLTSSPRRTAGLVPVTHDVSGFDILHVLNTPTGEAYAVAAGTDYLGAAETILLAQGILAYQIDQSATGQVLAAPRVWAMTDNKTWLNVVNDLLAAVGYQGVWSDWDGRLRLQPYQVPSSRAPEWLYDIGTTTSALAQERTAVSDLFDAPNRWVFYWSADPSGAAPIEGAGIYTFTNDHLGPTSVAARGRVIAAAAQQVDAVDQNALVAQAQISIDADLRLKTTFEVSAFPNPLHWHFDVCAINDPGLGPLMDVLVTQWTLPLPPAVDDMTMAWSLIQ